ncbi:ead/Ea22-like family protein [Citrobacter koseri]|uniref:ead/Ea22-like family protein n=1 Tax=Citrobacter koseri TaxID=545 RepID=UPI0023B1BAFD|nr:ead/Ea22-like family protein [Citrobacter koseri]
MSNIDKRALREAAEKATPGRWEYYPGNTSIEYNVDSMDEGQGSIVYVDSGDFTQKQTDLNGEFIASVNPATVLALLDELEAAKQDSARWFKAFEKSVSVGARYEERIAEQQRSLDQREFLLSSTDQVQREYAEALGCAGDNESILEAIDDMKKRIAELEAKLQTADKLQDSAFRHGLQHGFSLGQTDNQAGYEQCLEAYSSKGKGE